MITIFCDMQLKHWAVSEIDLKIPSIKTAQILEFAKRRLTCYALEGPGFVNLGQRRFWKATVPISYFFFFYGPPKVPRCRRSFGKVRPLR
jgi:hypothetical protein